jgi:mannosyltransferase
MMQRKAAKEQRREGKKHIVSAPLPLTAFALSLIILLIAAFLRFHNLGLQSFWNDEGNSYVQSTRTFFDIAANAARDIHPPGYYWLLAGWRLLVGESEFALRALSAFAGVLTVAFTYALGRRLHSAAAGLAAALFVALNTFSIYYSQETRMYALLALWAAAGMWALVKVLSAEYKPLSQKSPNSGTPFSTGKSSALSTQHSALKAFLPLALINAAGLYTQYAYPFIMLAQGVLFLLWLGKTVLSPSYKVVSKKPNHDRQTSSTFREHDRDSTASESQYSVLSTQHSSPLLTFNFQLLTAYIAANLLTLLLYLPWLPTAWYQVTHWPNTGQPIPVGTALAMIGGWFTFGLTYPLVPNSAAFAPLALLLLSVGVVAWWALLRRDRWWQMLVPVAWVVVPVGLFLFLGLFRPANLKLLLPAQVGYALWLGMGVGSWAGLAYREARADRLTLAFTLLQTGWLLAYLFTGLASLYNDLAYRRADYRAIVNEITADPRPGDAIVLDAPNQEEAFRYYYRGDAPVYPLPAGLGGDDAKTLAAVQNVIAHHSRIFVLFWGETERDPHRIVETALDSQTYEAGIDTWYGDVRLARYAAPVTLTNVQPSGARFGGHILLQEYALSDTSLRPGDVLQIRLDWRAEVPISMRYKVFLQLLNADGTLANGAQRDSEPGGGSMPTSAWTPGETVSDRHGLLIPRDLSAGEYTLVMGLYDADNPSARLPVGAGDYLTLDKITIQS